MIYIPRMMERSSTLGIFRWVQGMNSKKSGSYEVHFLDFTVYLFIHNRPKLFVNLNFHAPFYVTNQIILGTVKSLSEALILPSTNPQYGDRLFNELRVQYMKIASQNMLRTCCVHKLFFVFVLTFRTTYVLPMF